MFILNPRDKAPIYEQIRAQLTRQVAMGLLAPDAPLPSVRQLSGELGVNPNTIQKAYRTLEQEGLIYSVPGKGSFVTGDIAEQRRKQQAMQMETIRQQIRGAKELGIAREAIDEAVRAVYGEETYAEH